MTALSLSRSVLALPNTKRGLKIIVKKKLIFIWILFTSPNLLPENVLHKLRKSGLLKTFWMMEKVHHVLIKRKMEVIQQLFCLSLSPWHYIINNMTVL